jgi:hypothetical protein
MSETMVFGDKKHCRRPPQRPMGLPTPAGGGEVHHRRRARGSVAFSAGSSLSPTAGWRTSWSCAVKTRIATKGIPADQRRNSPDETNRQESYQHGSSAWTRREAEEVADLIIERSMPERKSDIRLLINDFPRPSPAPSRLHSKTPWQHLLDSRIKERL